MYRVIGECVLFTQEILEHHFLFSPRTTNDQQNKTISNTLMRYTFCFFFFRLQREALE